MKEMRHCNSFTLVLISLAISCVVRGQGFVNLDFESANLPVLPRFQSSTAFTTNAFPGWQVFYGYAPGMPTATVYHNGNALGSANVSVFGPDADYALSMPIIEGRFMPLLQSGQPAVLPSTPETRTASIAQTGLVPETAQSLNFKVAVTLAGFRATNFGVFLGGEKLSPIPLLTTPDYTLWGASVTAYTGMITELRFTVFSPDDRVYNDIGVDSFVFSPVAVPEPSTWTLLALGSAFFCCAMRRRSR